MNIKHVDFYLEKNFNMRNSLEKDKERYIKGLAKDEGELACNLIELTHWKSLLEACGCEICIPKTKEGIEE